MSAANSELPAHLKGSYFLEEQQRLQEEQDRFKEQKQTFEVERKNFTEAAIRLGWEVGSCPHPHPCFLKAMLIILYYSQQQQFLLKTYSRFSPGLCV